jgi:hypothetical protein
VLNVPGRALRPGAMVKIEGYSASPGAAEKLSAVFRKRGPLAGCAGAMGLEVGIRGVGARGQVFWYCGVGIAYSRALVLELHNFATNIV